MTADEWLEAEVAHYPAVYRDAARAAMRETLAYQMRQLRDAVRTASAAILEQFRRWLP